MTAEGLTVDSLPPINKTPLLVSIDVNLYRSTLCAHLTGTYNVNSIRYYFTVPAHTQTNSAKSLNFKLNDH